LAKSAARAVEWAGVDGDEGAPLDLRFCVVCVGCCLCSCDVVDVSEGVVDAGAGTVAVVTGIVVASGGSDSASSSCPELSVGWPVDMESTMLSLGVGIISERISSPSVLPSSSSSSIATCRNVSLNPLPCPVNHFLLVSSLLTDPVAVLESLSSHSSRFVLQPSDLAL
jgi:hypothetical protein